MMSCLGPRSSPGEDGGQFMAGMNGVLIVLLTFIAVRAGDTTHTRRARLLAKFAAAIKSEKRFSGPSSET
jgi:hypothetical protein